MNDQDPGDEQQWPEDFSWAGYFKDAHVVRAQTNPPAESYETAIIEAIDLLREYGASAGFVLFLATPEDGPPDGRNLNTAFMMSAGESGLTVEELSYALIMWLRNHQQMVADLGDEEN